MGLTVTVLGSAAMYASLERAASGYLLEIDETSLWMDAGGGTWQNLLRSTDYRTLDGVILTHRHPDHTIDLFQAFHARNYGDMEALGAISLWAPQETLDHVVAYTNDIENAFNLIPIDDTSVLDVAGARITFATMAHPPDTFGVRVESRHGVLAYSADSGPGGDFRRLAADADVFICEATFQDSDEEWEGHLRASQAAQIASDVNARALVLTHLPHDRDLDLSLKEARAAGSVDVVLAEDLLRIEVGA